jgi:hypothetical protein
MAAETTVEVNSPRGPTFGRGFRERTPNLVTCFETTPPALITSGNAG